MSFYRVLEKYPELSRNITYLEEEGKTVVIMAVNKVPQLVISLEE